jgi:uncharacterized membrane protein YphA (DoxX/SURF4 family)
MAIGLAHPTGTVARGKDEALTRLKNNPAYQAFWLLRIGFTVAPIVFGLDKFFGLLVDWDIYLASQFADILPGSVHQSMYAVGVVEVVAGLLVALKPRIGAYVVAVWLAGIITNLLLIQDFYDIALRDFGLLLAALTLARLASIFDRRPPHAR